MAHELQVVKTVKRRRKGITEEEERNEHIEIRRQMEAEELRWDAIPKIKVSFHVAPVKDLGPPLINAFVQVLPRVGDRIRFLNTEFSSWIYVREVMHTPVSYTHLTLPTKRIV